MDGLRLQTLVNKGGLKAGSAVGTTYDQYRPAGANNPITAANKIASPSVYIGVNPIMNGHAALQYGKPTLYAAMDRSGLAVGDYLVGEYGTFFVVSTIYPTPVALVSCAKDAVGDSVVVSIARMADSIAPGSTGTYSGSAIDGNDPFMTGWPCSKTLLGSGSKMISSGMRLPSDGRLPAAQFLLPASAPQIRWNDIITDADGQRYSVAAVEQSYLGWRLTAELWPSG